MRVEKGFINKRGEWISKPPYPWRRMDGRTSEEEIAAWRKYEHMKERHDAEKAGHSLPFLTRSEKRWVIFILLVVLVMVTMEYLGG